MCDADSLPVLTSYTTVLPSGKRAIRSALPPITAPVRRALHPKAVLVLDEQLAALLFEVRDQPVQRVGVLHRPACHIEV